MSKTQQKRKRKKTKSQDVTKLAMISSGWNTTDEEEIRRRVLRAEIEPMKVTNLELEFPYFSTYMVHSKTQLYTVEIRSLTQRFNNCSCADYDVNGLGTCKHIEKALLTLKKKGQRKFRQANATGSARAEIYLDPATNQVKLMEPQEKIATLEAHRLLKDFFSANGSLVSDAKPAIATIIRLIDNASETVRKSIRLSSRVRGLLTNFNDFTQKTEARDFFLQDVANGKYTLDIAKLPLYDYQKEGVIHLAFMEKAILADEMGLGKTVQAIIAAALLRKIRGIRKVLVVTPASLKAEWEEQITKFTGLPSVLIEGARGERLRQYQKDAFFYLTNYEQVVRDREDVQRLMAPDVVILDEAQRIKNWRTKTAATLKQLESPYAFVLTGTPIENRIDDIYSIVQFLYPKLMGPLFRFNREFYQLDDHGKPIGYKNLHFLHQRLNPILLRRLKRDVEEQLPTRTINTYFVAMSSEQRSRYEEQEMIVARLAAVANKRPLRNEEFKKLQIALASMRMLCDTPYILDQDCRICPKLDELENILEELFQDNATKIIIFSEWERMLFLVGDLLTRMNIGYAWHTGSVDQKQRREEIHRFKDESGCKVFLSTDCGAVGLNLQIANCVVNLDLPWNPAKLEQRIARAWRKHQTRAVQIINLVSEESIEHRMLGVLNLKQRLADSILDGGDVEEMDIPSGRKGFMEQLSKIMSLPPQAGARVEKETLSADKDPILIFQQEALARFKPRLHQLDVYKDQEGHQTLFAVVDGDSSHPSKQMQAFMKEIGPKNDLQLEVLDRAAFETIQRLCKAGVLSFNHDQVTSLYQSQATIESKHEEQEKRLRLWQKYKEPIERKEQFISLLIREGFYEEALAPLREMFEDSLKSFAILMGPMIDEEEGVSLDRLQFDFIAKKGLPRDAFDLAIQLGQKTSLIDKDKIAEIFNKICSIIDFINKERNKFCLNLAA